MVFNNWQFWLGLTVSALLLLLVVYRVDLGGFKDALGDAEYLYLVPAIALYFVAVYFRAVRWRYLLQPLRRFRVSRLYPVVVIGYMANNLLPARLGELVRSYYLARREDFSASTALATVAVERVYDGVTLLAFAALAGPVLLALGEFDGASDTARTTWIVFAAATSVLFIGALAALTALAAMREVDKFLDAATRVVPTRFRPKARNLAETFVQGLRILNSPRKHLGLFLLSLPVWVLEGSMYFLLAYSFGIDGYFGSVGVLLLVVMLVTATSNLATSVPISIGGLGVFEVAAQETLMVLGVGATQAGLYDVFVHLVALWLPVNLVGLALLWKQHISLKQLAGPIPVTAGERGRSNGYVLEPNPGPALTPGEDLP